MSKYGWNEIKGIDGPIDLKTGEFKVRDFTNGVEFLNGKDPSILINSKSRVVKLKCEYCGCDVLAVWDEHNLSTSWWPYLGKQAERANTYKYSPIIQTIKDYYNLGENERFTQERGNNLLNVHARYHSVDWSYRASNKSIRMLCNSCFLKTYNRYQVEIGGGRRFDAVSVIPELGETIDSVMKEFGIDDYVVLGKGSKFY